MDKKAYIMQGIPGSSKSTWVKENLPNAMICSADNFFYKNCPTCNNKTPQFCSGLCHGKGQVYQFDAKQLSLAHQKCFRDFINALMIFKDNPEVSVVCDNTNLNFHDITPYTMAASAFDWDYQIVKTDCPWEIAAARNIHGVPANKINEMYLRLQSNKLPTYMKDKVIVVKSFQ